MSQTGQDPDDRLRAVLRAAHPSAELPPRFSESVWRKIRAAESARRPDISWLEALTTLLFRPAFATAALALVILAGGALGTRAGQERKKNEAQARYLELVSPLHRPASR